MRDFVLAHLAKTSGRSRNAVTAAVTLVMRQALGGAGGRGRGAEWLINSVTAHAQPMVGDWLQSSVL